MSILNLTQLSTQDDQLIQVVATFLREKGIPESSSHAVALNLLWALERYNQQEDLDQCAWRLGLDPHLIKPPRMKASLKDQ